MNILLIPFGILQYNISYQKVEKDVVKDKIILNKVADLPDYTKDIDPNYELLRNVIKSSKLEEWSVKIDANYDYYDIYLNNALNTVSIRCRLRMYRGRLYGQREGHPSVSIFQISRTGLGTINLGDDKKSHYLILNFMWDYVLDHHQKIHDEHLEHYKKTKELIGKELKTLNRDKQLEKLLEDE